MPKLCSSLLRSGCSCKLPIGHIGECEVYFGKRRNKKMVNEDTFKAKLTCYRKIPRIGVNYQAVIPEFIGNTDTKTVEH